MYVFLAFAKCALFVDTSNTYSLKIIYIQFYFKNLIYSRMKKVEKKKVPKPKILQTFQIQNKNCKTETLTCSICCRICSSLRSSCPQISQEQTISGAGSLGEAVGLSGGCEDVILSQGFTSKEHKVTGAQGQFDVLTCLAFGSTESLF